MPINTFKMKTAKFKDNIFQINVIPDQEVKIKFES